MVTVDEIYKKISGEICREDFLQLVCEKIDSLKGLCDEPMAALLVVHELGYGEKLLQSEKDKLCPFQGDVCWKEKCGIWDSGAGQCSLISVSDGIWSIVGSLRGEK